MTVERAEIRRLIVRIERDLIEQAYLRTLLRAAGASLSGHREELREIKARARPVR
jgi:hypothetical protein